MNKFETAEKYLYDLQLFGIKLGLEQVEELFAHAGNPQNDLNFIHLAGTNGKGSTAAMLNATLQAAGYKVGLYTSPHLISVRERFRINGQAISRNEFSKTVEKLKPAVDKMKEADRCPTFFEMTTAIAATFFADHNVDFVIWETGMGGRFDATNIVTPICSIITGISYDHQAYLGDAIQDIAYEKAGIIKPGIPCFCGNMAHEAFIMIQNQAIKCQSKLSSIIDFFADIPVEKVNSNNHFIQNIKIGNHLLEVSLQGEIQLDNAMLCYMVLDFLSKHFKLNLPDAIKGFKQVKWPGRLQILPNGNILDGAHNPQGIQGLTEFLKKEYPNQKFTILFANFADKNAEGCIKELMPFAEQFFFAPVISFARKAYSNEELEAIVQKYNSDIPVTSYTSPNEALAVTTKTKKLITGSLYLAGDILKHYFTEDEIINI